MISFSTVCVCVCVCVCSVSLLFFFPRRPSSRWAGLIALLRLIGRFASELRAVKWESDRVFVPSRIGSEDARWALKMIETALPTGHKPTERSIILHTHTRTKRDVGQIFAFLSRRFRWLSMGCRGIPQCFSGKLCPISRKSDLER